MSKVSGTRLWIAILFLFPILSHADTPKFKETGTIKFEAEVNKPFSQKLRDLLVDPNMPGPLTWQIAQKPGWMTLDTVNEKITGTPGTADLGTTAFKLSVFSNEGADFNHPAQVTVRAVPSWSESPLNLGKHKEDDPFQFDLNTKVTVPGGGAITFSVEGNKPGWLQVASNGQLTGTPRRIDVGAYSGFSFIATSTTGGVSKVPAFGEVLKTIHPPKWIGNPLPIDNAQEDFAFILEVSNSGL